MSIDARDILRCAAAIQRDMVMLGAAPAPSNDVEELFDRLVTDEHLRETTRSLFIDGYYALAVEEAFKCVNNTVKKRSGIAQDGAALMRQVFSVNSPILRVNELANQSERDQQQGYMDIFAGCMTGIRNPRAHEHRYLDEPAVALEMLVWANHLLRMAKVAKKTRNRKSKARNTQGSTP